MAIKPKLYNRSDVDMGDEYNDDPLLTPEDMGEQVEQTHERDPFHDLESQDMSPGLATAGILVATGVVKATLLGPLAFFLGPVGMFVKRQITGIFGHETKE